MSIAQTLLLSPAAFLAGVLMFLAPCTLPIVPGYLAFIAGGKGKVVRNALAFILGFSIIFILLGTFAGLLGGLLGPYREYLGRIAGALIVFFGLTMLGLRLPLLSQERHARIPSFVRVGSLSSSLLIGALFALGWSPCIGPLLGTLLLFASAKATALSGAFLLAVFSAGLGLPFLLTALLLERAGERFGRWGAAALWLSRIGALVLIALGLLMLLGKAGLLVSWGYGALDFLGYSRLLRYL